MTRDAHGGGAKLEGMRRAAGVVGLGLLAAAVVRELKRPPETRSWHGRVFGVVPYDLRPPTVERIKEQYWNPSDANIITPKAFGVGWGVNFGAVAKKLDLVA